MSMHKFLLVGVLVATAMGCSSAGSRSKANGSFKYIEETKQVSLQVPENVDAPDFSRDFNLPPMGEAVDPNWVGESVDIRSPVLVLPIVTGSHVEEGTKSAKVSFDQVDDSQPLDTAIWNSLLNFLDQQGIGVDSFDPEQRRLVTDWMIIEEELDSGWLSWTSTERSVGERFEFELDVKPHGRSATLNVVLRDYLETTGEEVTAELSEEQKRRDEVNILNQVVGFYDYQIRVEDARRRQQIRQGLLTELGFNDAGDPAYLVNADYNLTWDRLLLVLQKLNFTITDLDRTNGLLFANYGGSEKSWWSNLWGSDANALPLEQQDYRFRINPYDGKTSVTLMTGDNEVLAAETVNQLYARFAEVMSTDDLDF